MVFIVWMELPVMQMFLIWQWALAVGSLLLAFSWRPPPPPPASSNSCPPCHPQRTGSITCLFVPFVIQPSQLLGFELGAAAVGGLKTEKSGCCEGEDGGFLPETTKLECWPTFTLSLLITIVSDQSEICSCKALFDWKRGRQFNMKAGDWRWKHRLLSLIHWKWQQRFFLVFYNFFFLTT